MTAPVHMPEATPRNRDDTASLPGIAVRLLPDGMARTLVRTQRSASDSFDAQYGGRLSPLI